MKKHPLTVRDQELINGIVDLLAANKAQAANSSAVDECPLRQFSAQWVDEEMGPRKIAVLARTEVEARQIIEDVTGAVSLQITSR